MNGLPETIEDFIELRRANANALEVEAGGMPNQFQRELIADLRDEADRLEAAWKRERATTENSSAVGNAAKMREALLYIKQWREDCIDGEGADLVDDMIAKVDAALSAPPRNCDRFNNAVDAMAEFKRIHNFCATENRRRLEDCPDCGKEWCSLAWLFATAEEYKEEK